MRIFNSHYLAEWEQARTIYQTMRANPSQYKLKDIESAKSLMLSCQNVIAQEFQKITRMAEKAAAIEQRMTQQLDAVTFLAFKSIVIRLVTEIFYDGTEETELLCDEFEQRIVETLVFKEVNGDDLHRLTPIKESEAMLDTIPLEAEETANRVIDSPKIEYTVENVTQNYGSDNAPT